MLYPAESREKPNESEIGERGGLSGKLALFLLFGSEPNIIEYPFERRRFQRLHRLDDGAAQVGGVGTGIVA